LPGKSLNRPLTYQSAAFSRGAGADPLSIPPAREGVVPGLGLRYRIAGATPVRTAPVYRWQWMSGRFLEDDPLRSAPDLSSFPFLTVEQEEKRISIAAGRWKLDSSLILPPGYTVVAGAGTRLQLVRGASIISRSPLLFEGEEQEPIVIDSGKDGGGLVLLDAGGRSLFRWVELSRLALPSSPGWDLTGAVTFYRSDVVFDSCRFRANRNGDDMVNVIRSTATVRNSQFLDAFGDALDIDFCRAEVVGCTFSAPGNDGVDISGSTVKLVDLAVMGAGDKGISVGENSVVKASGVLVDGAFVAFACKDGSWLDIEQSKTRDYTWGLAAFRKKPEFGPARITVDRATHIAAGKNQYLRQGGSSILIGKVPVEVAEMDDAPEFLYREKRGGK
jgi:hypothetical protein